MARVRVVMMQRDEALLLPAWLAVHAYLFGFESLTVLDNGSTDPAVIDTLRRAERAGVDIRWQHVEPSDFVNKGVHFRNVVLGWDESGIGYDFALPVDCDEFPVVFTPTGLDCRRATIHATFDSLLGETRAFGIGYGLFNLPGRPRTFVLESNPRSFLPAHAVADIDHGLHHCRSRRAEGRCETDFGLLHFRNRPWPEMKQRVDRMLVALAGSPVLPEPHLLAVHGQSAAGFESTFADRLPVVFPHFARLLDALGIESGLLGTPTPSHRAMQPDEVAFETQPGERVAFDGAAYLARHPDVGQAGWPALVHYLVNGAGEGRPLA